MCVLGAESEELKQHLRDINERSTYLTGQLHKAANDAEQGIQKLVAGVVTLRDIAAVLASLDKLSLVPDNTHAQ